MEAAYVINYFLESISEEEEARTRELQNQWRENIRLARTPLDADGKNLIKKKRQKIQDKEQMICGVRVLRR